MRVRKDRASRIDLAQALYYLGELPPEDIPDIACQALEEGFDGPNLRELAWLREPTMRDVGDRFERALEEMGRTPISKSDAGVHVAKDVAARIVSGGLDPYAGARRIWWDIWEECGRPDELTAFVGLASQYEEDPEHRREYAEDIISEAKRLIEARS